MFMLTKNKLYRIIFEELKRLKEEDYRGSHKAPSSSYGSPLYDVTLNGTYPEDFYSPRGHMYYGGSLEWDRAVVTQIQKYRNKPEKAITIYRAVPNNDKIVAINPGDWVTISKEYADMHGESALDGDYKVLKMNVPANTLWTDGNSPYEWGYNP